MMSKLRPSHVVLNATTHEMHCKHCGTKQQVKFPMGIDDAINLFKQFEKAHKGCNKA